MKEHIKGYAHGKSSYHMPKVAIESTADQMPQWSCGEMSGDANAIVTGARTSRRHGRGEEALWHGNWKQEASDGAVKSRPMWRARISGGWKEFELEVRGEWGRSERDNAAMEVEMESLEKLWNWWTRRGLRKTRFWPRLMVCYVVCVECNTSTNTRSVRVRLMHAWRQGMNFLWPPLQFAIHLQIITAG